MRQKICTQLVKNQKQYLWIVAWLFIGFISACRQNSKTDISGNDPVEINLTIERKGQQAQNVFLVGDKVWVKLTIINNREVPVQIDNFSFDAYQFGYFGANTMHLIAPDGQDLLHSYRSKISLTGDYLPIDVAPQSEYQSFVLLSRCLRLYQPGQYVFWITVTDNFGNLAHSNQASFQIESLPQTVPAELVPLTLRIKEISSTSVDGRIDLITIEATLTNNSERPLAFLKLQYGSYLGRTNPTYELTLTDSEGRIYPTQSTGVEGSFSDEYPVYDDENIVTLAPGESYIIAENDVFYRAFAGLESFNDNYMLTMDYIVAENISGLGLEQFRELQNRKGDLFIGLIESNTVTIPSSP